MTNRTFLIAVAATVLVAGIYTAIVYPQLPDMIPAHWNIHGEVDRWHSRTLGVWMVPGLMAAFLGLWWALPKLSPKSASIDAFRPAYNSAMFSLFLFFGLMQIITLQAALPGSQVPVSRWIMLAMLAMMIALGNVMGKARRNYWFGVRTPWTLESDLVWNRTHRLAAYLMVGAGVLGILLILVGVPEIIALPLVLGASLYPCVYSYTLYRQLVAQGQIAPRR